MIFSDGLPVQFWLADCETFNEKEVSGINRACWCQPWQCDDEIIIQFTEADDSSPSPEFSLLLKNSSDEILSSIVFTSVSGGVFQAAFTPQEEDVCDEDVQLLIISGEVFKIIDPDEWVNTFSSNAMTATETGFTQDVVSGDNWGNDMPIQIDLPNPKTITFDVQITVAGTWTGQVDITFFITKSGGIETATDAIAITGNVTNQTHNISLAKANSQTGESLRIQVSGTATGTAEVTINIPIGQILYYNEENIQANSDCLNIRTVQDETTLIEYSNNRNYYGLIYENASPAPSFFLRVPSVFFHERFPQEDRAIERTGSTIVTSSKLKTQRLLQVKHAPDYFHKKLIMVLSQHNVEIDGKQWKKEEAYEKDDGDIHYPLKKATVYLTEKNFLARNVL